MIYERLEIMDTEVEEIVRAEEVRQDESLELIASENFTSLAVLEAIASVLTNKYSEGQVGRRYYGGNENVDAMENLCKARALSLFRLDPEVWDVNVQALSGTVANLAVYLALAGKDGRILGMDLPSGGHLSHGYKTPKRKISASSIFFNSDAYRCTSDGKLDYEDIRSRVKSFEPDILICGGSSFPRDFDYRILREAASDSTFLMMDMSHISGLIAAGLMNNPFEYCDVVTTTTHKILRGPRAALIFFRKEKKIVSRGGTESVVNVKSAIDSAVFPALQGGPHNNKIAAMAVALKQANTEEYKSYAKQVILNAKALERRFKELGYTLFTDGTDCHMVVVCLKDHGVGGAEVERVCELANISLNKNCVPEDTSPLNPSGIRIGTPAMTTRGLVEKDFVKVAELVHEGIAMARIMKLKFGDEKYSMDEFTRLVKGSQEIFSLRSKVKLLLTNFRAVPKISDRYSTIK